MNFNKRELAWKIKQLYVLARAVTFYQLYLFLIIKTSERREFDGFNLYSYDKDTKKNFFSFVTASLKLIKKHDLRRYKRAKKYLPNIVDANYGMNCYMHLSKSFLVQSIEDHSVEYFASSIVHESVHGYLLSKGFPYYRSRRHQHESICVKEQFALLRKIIQEKDNISEAEKQKEISTYEEHFKEGLHREWWDTGRVREVHLNNLKAIFRKDFVQKIHYKNGQVELEERIVRGRKNGQYRYYYENGNVKQEGEYKDNKYHGLNKWFYEDGNITWEVFYEDGERMGSSRRYYKNGNVQEEGEFKDNECCGLRKAFHSDGTIERETYYVNGKAAGSSRIYYANGKIRYEGEYKDGEYHGLNKWFYENGTIKIAAHYKDGEMHGNAKWYNEDGSLSCEENYSEGEPA